METPQGRILSLHIDESPPRAVVEITSSLRCARCLSGKGCGAGLIGADDANRHVDALLVNDVQLQAGDRVCIELAPNNVLQAALIAYGLPLCGAVGGALLGSLAGMGDSGAAGASVAGAALGILIGRRRLQRADCLHRFTPVVASRLVGDGG